MNGPVVQIQVRNVYGNDLIYPINEAAKRFAAIAGKKTLASNDLANSSDPETGTSLAPIYNTSQVLLPRRYEDRKDDAFTVFNPAQENLIQGGLSGRSASGRRSRTREVGGVNENVRLNKGLWALMDALVRHKNGEEIFRAA